MAGKVLGSVLLGVIGHSTYVEYNNYQSIPKTTEFSIGSADDIVMDNLNTGDVILFNRRWYQYHLPTAITIAAYKYINNTDFDHGGIVIIDSDTGIPMVYELTPWKGYQYRKFNERILYSKSQQILVLPLHPRTEFTAKEKSEVTTIVKSATAIDSTINKKELTETTTFLMKKMFKLERNKNIYCSSSELIVSTLHRLEVFEKASNTKTILDGQTELERKFVTLKDFLDRNISFEKVVDDQFKNTDKKTLKSINLARNDILIRTQ